MSPRITKAPAGDRFAVTLSGVAYPIALLTIGQMRNVVPANAHAGLGTQDAVDALFTVLHSFVKAGGSKLKFEEFQSIRTNGAELVAAQITCALLLDGVGTPKISSAPLIVTLAGRDYPIAALTIAEMRYALPSSGTGGITSMTEMTALLKSVQICIGAGGAPMTDEEFDAITGVTTRELVAAQVKCSMLIFGLPSKPAKRRKAGASGEAEAAGVSL